MKRHGKIKIGTFVFLLVGLYVSVLGFRYFSLILAERNVRNAIEESAFRWRDAGRTEALLEFKSEMSGLGFDDPDSVCDFYAYGRQRHVKCEWYEVLSYPLIGKKKDFLFDAHFVIGDDDSITQGGS